MPAVADNSQVGGVGRLIPLPLADELTRLAHVIARLELSEGADDEAVADALYREWYLPAEPGVFPGPRLARSVGQPLVPLLRAAHAQACQFERGWVVLTELGGGSCVAARGEEQRVLRPGEFYGLDRPAAPVAPGEVVAAVRRIDGFDEQTGYWVTRSSSGEPAPPLGRLYFNTPASGVAPVLHELTARLAGTWSIKCPATAEQYWRVDSVVCYVPKAGEAAARKVAEGLLAAAAGRLLRPRVPPLTAALGPGAGWADDPGGGESFGANRCRLLAPAVRRLVSAAGDPVEIFAGALAEAGIDLDRPWRTSP